MKRRTRSLATRLTRMNLLVSGAVLVLAALAFFSYDLLSFRRDLIRNLDAEAQIIGDNLVSALLFNDQPTAAATLRGLKGAPDVLGAAIVTRDGTVFAHYGVDTAGELESHSLAASEKNRFWSSGTHVLVARRVTMDGNTIGVVYISAQLAEFGQRARRYLLIACVIWVFCMGAALAISSFARRVIAQPAIALAEVARHVSRDQDYSVRARVPADNSEIAVLTDAFNTMLTQIQERDVALIQARNSLESRVEERTAELLSANRELEAFSYTVAHDLRNPLTAINAIAFLLTQTHGNTSDPGMQANLANLQTTAANMGMIIENLLNFSQSKTAAIKSTTVHLSAIAREVAAELRATDRHRDVEFSIAEVPEVLADAGLMRIVLQNLLGNAWKYTSQHPKACIEFGAKVFPLSGQRAERLVYFVRDDGAGFDPGRADQLFEPFKRLHGTGDFPGTGIGLATVQRILTRHGGSIWAEGGIEKGATFYFTVN